MVVGACRMGVDRLWRTACKDVMMKDDVARAYRKTVDWLLVTGQYASTRLLKAWNNNASSTLMCGNLLSATLFFFSK